MLELRNGLNSYHFSGLVFVTSHSMAVVGFIDQDDAVNEAPMVVIHGIGDSWGVNSLQPPVGVLVSIIAFPRFFGRPNSRNGFPLPLDTKGSILKFEMKNLIVAVVVQVHVVIE